jgi:ATP-dependent Clp protease ATP-binding subunit ClpA
MTDFDMFSPAAHRALEFARAAAERMNHDSIGTEHLLLGIVEERNDLAVYFLNLLDVRLKPLVEKVLAFVEQGEPHVGTLELTARARAALEIAEEERRRLGHPQVGTVHLLMGLLDVPECIGVKVLQRMNVDVEDVSAALRLLYEPDNGRPPLGPILERLRNARLEHGDREHARFHVDVSEDDLGGRAKLIVSFARQSARMLDHESVGTDHLLMGLLIERDGVAAQVLTAMGLTEHRLGLAVRFGRGLRSLEQEASPRIQTLTPRAQNVLALARFSAQRARLVAGEDTPPRLAGRLQKRLLIDSGDVLLGLLDEGHGGAIMILESFGLDQDEIRARLRAHARWRRMKVRPKAHEPASIWEWTNQQLIRRQWSLADLARESEIRRARLRSWVQGKGRPSSKSCDALAAAVSADPNLVRRLAGHPPAAHRPAVRGGAPAIHALVDQVTWNEERVTRIAALLQAIIDGDAEQATAGGLDET